MITLIITQADNDTAAENEATSTDTFWDIVAHCPTANALSRMHDNMLWFVNRDGARPAGSQRYWYQFSAPLQRAIDAFSQHRTPILGIFQLHQHKDFCQHDH